MRLQGKIAVITGAAKGIGKETAKVFAREGAKVVICDSDVNAGQNTLQEILAIQPDSDFYQLDVTKRDQVDIVIQGILSKYGGIDILINNAGINQDALLQKMTEDQWDRVIDINLKGVFNCTQAVIGPMIQQKKGKIINASSIVGIYGNFGQSNYAATKFGVIGLTKTWAKELGRKGINVNAVAPGFILTDMTKLMPQKVLDMVKERTPLGRLGETIDVANLYLFLASSESDFIHGAVISVDGGLVQ